MLDALRGEFHVRIHRLPLRRIELFDRKQLVFRLLAGFSSVCLFRIRVGTDQRGEIGKAQLLRNDLALQRWPWFAHLVGKVAMNVAVSNLSVEIAIAKGERFLGIEIGCQMALGRVGRCVRQSHANDVVEIAQVLAGKLQIHIDFLGR